MCMVSAVMDYGKQIPQHQWTLGTFADYQEVLRRLEALDKKLDQPDCHGPAKALWMKEVEARLSALEKSKRKKKAKR